MRYVKRMGVEIIFFYIRYTKYIVVLQVVHYVDLLAAFAVGLKKFNFMHNVSQFDNVHAQNKCVIENLLNVKKMHLKLCTALETVNDIFGWTLFVFIIHTSVDFIYMILYAFYSWKMGQYTQFLSMYLFFSEYAIHMR